MSVMCIPAGERVVAEQITDEAGEMAQCSRRQEQRPGPGKWGAGWSWGPQSQFSLRRVPMIMAAGCP